MEGKFSQVKNTNALFAAFIALAVAVSLSAPASAFAADYKAGSVKGSTVVETAQHEVTTQAKTKKVKKQSFSTLTKVINKKATKVKRGSSKLIVKGGNGYIKFIAPKTKTYSFTFSGVKSTNGTGGSAFVEVQTPYSYDSSYSFLTKVKTKGGESNTLWLAYKGRTFPYYTNDLSRPIAKRTGKVKLAKGQAVYFYFSGTRADTYVNLKVK